MMQPRRGLDPESGLTTNPRDKPRLRQFAFFLAGFEEDHDGFIRKRERLMFLESINFLGILDCLEFLQGTCSSTCCRNNVGDYVHERSSLLQS